MIPKEDFASEQFDYPTVTKPRKLLLIYSTPRSGSTMLCDMVYSSKICLPHEYFQPFQYRGFLAERWGVDENDDAAYVDALIKHRTGPTGVLGINLHGEHLVAWQKALVYLPDTIEQVIHVHLRRRDRVAQAVSYSIALQTGNWSSAFNKKGRPDYKYADIRKRLGRLKDMDKAIVKHLRSVSDRKMTVHYEDMVRDAEPVLRFIGVESAIQTSSRIKSQTSDLNRLFVERYHKDDRITSRIRRALLNGI